MIRKNSPSQVGRLFAAIGASLVTLASVNAAVLKVEVESGSLGASGTNGTDGAIQYIARASGGTGNNPTNATHVATYTVNFPAAATYDLYVRVRVGTGVAHMKNQFGVNLQTLTYSLLNAPTNSDHENETISTA